MTNITNESSIAAKIWSNPVVYDIRTIFYLVTPGESTYENIDEVPEIVDKAVPYFMVMILIEAILNNMSGHKERMPRWSDMYSSICAGFLMGLPQMLVRNIEIVTYIWLHNNYAMYALDWNSPMTWWLAMFGVDLAYYWVHRCAHEINFMWAAHQVHHSSEDYNLSTALRQSVVQRYSSWIFYLPLAFFIPPSIFLVHIHFNLIYQFWIHTETVNTLGPLEWILNTASHHRVHHGRNRYCIDKNYAGVFIIWDRMFGTFAKEQTRGEIAYGLVHPLNSWDPIYTQGCHWRYILGKAWETKGLKNKISIFLKGPGWEPGKPRLGHITDIPDIKGPVKKYSTPATWSMHLYLFTQFTFVFVAKEIYNTKQDLSLTTSFALALYFLWSLTNIGYFYEHKSYACISELLRCAVYLFVDALVCTGNSCSTVAIVGRVVMGVSMVIMMMLCGKQITRNGKTGTKME